MSVLKLYGCAIVLILWAVLLRAGVRGEEMAWAIPLSVAVMMVIAEVERSKRRRNGRS